jgi:hypothetical protein
LAGWFVVAALNINHRRSQSVLELGQTHPTLRGVPLLDCLRSLKPHRNESKQEKTQS